MPWINRYNTGSEEPWNANKIWLEQLMHRCDERDLFSNDRNYIQWYTSLRTIYSIIHWKYDKLIDTAKKPDEKEYYTQLKKKLELEFKKAEALLNNMSRSRDLYSKQITNMAITELQKSLDNINFQINDFIVLSGIVNIDGDSRTWQEKIAKELNVDMDIIKEVENGKNKI